MATYTVTQTVEYIAKGIEADSEDEAREIYLQDQDMYYSTVVEENIELA